MSRAARAARIGGGGGWIGPVIVWRRGKICAVFGKPHNDGCFVGGRRLPKLAGSTKTVPESRARLGEPKLGGDVERERPRPERPDFNAGGRILAAAPLGNIFNAHSLRKQVKGMKRKRVYTIYGESGTNVFFVV